MSDSETPRHQSGRSSIANAEPKRKSKGRKEPKRPKTPETTFPFSERDEFSNVIIKVGDKTLYSNNCLLAYNSPVLMQQMKPNEPVGKGKGKPSSSSDIDLDWSDRKYKDVCELLAFIDPRCEENISDEDAIRLLPLAKEFQVKPLLKVCEKTITQSFYLKRKSRRITMELIMQNLELADTYDFPDLRKMSIEACVMNDNPYSNKTMTESKAISEATKVQILERKLERATGRLSREREKMRIQSDDNLSPRKAESRGSRVFHR